MSLSCAQCSVTLLATSFYERAGQPYCAPCFLKRFLACMACGERILFAEGVGPEESAAESRARLAKEQQQQQGSQQYLTLTVAGEERIVHHRCLKCDACQKALCPPVPDAAASSDASAPPEATPSSSSALGSVSLFQHSGAYYCQGCYFAAHGHTCNHCHQLIATAQSIQMAPEEDYDHLPDSNSSESEGHRLSATASGEGDLVYYHLDCFVCTTCSTDLRALEAEQDAADDAAFAAGLEVDTLHRPPVYASDPQSRKVYCWTHFKQHRPARANLMLSNSSALGGFHSSSPTSSAAALAAGGLHMVDEDELVPLPSDGDGIDDTQEDGGSNFNTVHSDLMFASNPLASMMRDSGASFGSATGSSSAVALNSSPTHARTNGPAHGKLSALSQARPAPAGTVTAAAAAAAGGGLPRLGSPKSVGGAGSTANSLSSNSLSSGSRSITGSSGSSGSTSDATVLSPLQSADDADFEPHSYSRSRSHAHARHTPPTF